MVRRCRQLVREEAKGGRHSLAMWVMLGDADGEGLIGTEVSAPGQMCACGRRGGVCAPFGGDVQVPEEGREAAASWEERWRLGREGREENEN